LFSPDGTLLAIGGTISGLATWRPCIVHPDLAKVLLGKVTGGTFDSLRTKDDSGLVVCKFIVPNLSVAPIQVEVEGVSNVETPVGLTLNVRSRMKHGGLFKQTLQLWNWTTSNWDPSDTDVVPIGLAWIDRSLVATGTVTRYVSPTRTLRMKCSISQTGPSAVTLWCHETDFVDWEVKAF